MNLPRCFLHRQSKYLRSLIIIALLFVFSGCATVKEAGRGFLGISTKVLEEGLPNAKKEVFAIDMDSCYEKVKSALIENHAYVYAEKLSPRMIAVYLSVKDTAPVDGTSPMDDTTPVGLFFSTKQTNQTLVEVSSPSTYAKEIIAKAVFGAMKQYVVKEDVTERKIDAQAENLGK
ncbi:MAG: hypothetical protein WC561_00645 [Candidatus Omnitrophota bacterium]